MAAAPALSLRIGDRFVTAGDAAAIEAAIAAHNAEARLAGLEDRLNPFLLDAGRVRALLAGLAAPPAGVGEAALYLNSPDLPLRPTSPVGEAALRGARVTLVEVQGKTALLAAKADIDCPAAQAMASEARGLLGEAEKAATPANSRVRFALALAWRENAVAAAGCAPGAAAEADRKAAEAAASRLAVPMGGMP